VTGPTGATGPTGVTGADGSLYNVNNLFAYTTGATGLPINTGITFNQNIIGGTGISLNGSDTYQLANNKVYLISYFFEYTSTATVPVTISLRQGSATNIVPGSRATSHSTGVATDKIAVSKSFIYRTLPNQPIVSLAADSPVTVTENSSLVIIELANIS
jgi:hypothetical protein